MLIERNRVLLSVVIAAISNPPSLSSSSYEPANATSTGLTTLAPYSIDFSRAATAAAKLFHLIDRKSEIDPFDRSGIVPEETVGLIELENITFAYPTRPGIHVLENFTLKVPAGKVTALVVSTNTSVVCISNGSDLYLGTIWFWEEYTHRLD